MVAKKKGDGVEMPEANGDAFLFDLKRANPEFSLDALLTKFKEKCGENAQRKISIAERIENAKKAIGRLQAMITNLEVKAQGETGQVFLTLVVRPIAEELRSAFPNASVDVFGPLGLSGNCTVSISKKGANQASKVRGADCRLVTLVPMENGIGIRDYSETNNEHQPGSIGYLSGLNHPVVPVPMENALGFITEWLMK